MKTYSLINLTVGDQTIPVEAYINKRAKRFKICLDSSNTKAIVTLPSKRFEKQAIKFATENVTWVARQIAQSQQKLILQPGISLPVLGINKHLLHKEFTRKSVWEEDNSLTIYCPKNEFEETLKAYLKEKFRNYIFDRVNFYADRVNQSYSKIYIRDGRSSWGCCSSKRNLSFNLKLIFTPLVIINYVVAHEVCHLIEMNHSKKFWDLVSALDPNYAAHRKWLREEGKKLL